MLLKQQETQYLLNLKSFKSVKSTAFLIVRYLGNAQLQEDGWSVYKSSIFYDDTLRFYDVAANRALTASRNKMRNTFTMQLF